jgi:hypothetical protein
MTKTVNILVAVCLGINAATYVRSAVGSITEGLMFVIVVPSTVLVVVCFLAARWSAPDASAQE